MRISDWSSDVCSSDLTILRPIAWRSAPDKDRIAIMSSMVSRIAILAALVSSTSSTAATSDAPQSNWEQVRQSINTPAPQSAHVTAAVMEWGRLNQSDGLSFNEYAAFLLANPGWPGEERSEEHTSELQSLMRISYAVFCLQKQKIHKTKITHKQ